MTHVMPKSQYDLFNEALYADVSEDDQFYNRRPYLAHYTNLQNLENIIHGQEIWFSNPLFMNDLEEVRFGLLEGLEIFLDHDSIRNSLGSADRYQKYATMLNHYFKEFEEKYLIDVYVFCLSEHDPAEVDGKLSMWRGYGGQGNGAAIVFDTSKIKYNDNSPLRLARVEYGSSENRRKFLGSLADSVSRIVNKVNLHDAEIYLLSFAVFQRLKMFSLFSKHHGFSEEKEWRVVYFSDLDKENILENMKHYHNGPRGVEPKLKLKIEPIEGIVEENFNLNEIISSIILGPSTSTPLAVRSVGRMLDKLNHSELKGRLHPSSIPLRPIG